MGSCIFMVVLLDSSTVRGKKKQTVFYYAENKCFLNVVFVTWIIALNIFFYICHPKRRNSGRAVCTTAGRVTTPHSRHGAGQPVQGPELKPRA